MSSGHLFYIPLILLAGLVLGLMLGRKSVMAAMQAEAARKARREARRRQAGDTTPPTNAGSAEAGDA